MKPRNSMLNTAQPARFGVANARELLKHSRAHGVFAGSGTCSRLLQRAENAVKVLLTLMLLVAASGCSGIEPWVKPYERDRLADPIMFLDANPVSSAYIQHVYEAREGARGGEGAAGGGCGCN